MSLRWRIGLHCGDDFLPVPSTAQCLVAKRLSLLCMVPARIKQAKEPRRREKRKKVGTRNLGHGLTPFSSRKSTVGSLGWGPARKAHFPAPKAGDPRRELNPTRNRLVLDIEGA